MSGPFQLFRLQQVDSQLDQVRQRLDEIDQILGEDEALRQAKAARDEAKDVKAEAESELRKAENDVQDQQVKIDQNQARLYGGKVTNPKELEDLQQEAEALKRHLGTLEDAQLEKMLAMEESQGKLDAAEKKLKEVRSERAEEHEELSAEHEQLEAEEARLSDERAAAASSVSDEHMRTYLKLREQKGGLAVARVEKKTCGACGATLSDVLAQAARSPSELSRCSTCKRILYAG